MARCAIWGMREEGDDEGTGRWYYTRCSDPPDAGHKDIVALKNESDEVSRQDVWLSTGKTDTWGAWADKLPTSARNFAASMISFTGACLKSWAAPNAIKTKGVDGVMVAFRDKIVHGMVRRAHGDTKSLDATTVVVRYLEEDVARAFMSLLPEATEWTGPVNIHGNKLFPGLDPKVLRGYEYEVVLWDNEDRGFKEGELQFHAQQLPSDDERVLPFRLVA